MTSLDNMTPCARKISADFKDAETAQLIASAKRA